MPAWLDKALSFFGLSRIPKGVYAFSANTGANINKEINPYTGLVQGNIWQQTGMPWVGSEGRKAVLTEWFWQPIRGQPRRVDTAELRKYAQSYWVYTCVKTLQDEISALEWDIIPTEDAEYDEVKEKIKFVKNFLKRPNANGETFQHILRAGLKDLLECDAMVWVKVFSKDSYDFDMVEPKSGAPLLKPLGQRKLIELYARDGASFLKEVDKFGFCKGYWQYSYSIPAHPVWFNKDEVCYIMAHPRSMSPYGYSPVQATLDIIKSLYWSVLWNKSWFEENATIPAILSVEGMSEAEMKRLREYWEREIIGKPHKLALINAKINYQPLQVSQKEMEWLDSQKWYAKLVISAFGLTPAEIGFTEDLNRATSSTQAEVFRRKGIRPLLKIIEDAINTQIIPEFGFDDIEFKFVVHDPIEEQHELANAEIKLRTGLATINEIREKMGLQPVPWGDMNSPDQNVYGVEGGTRQKINTGAPPQEDGEQEANASELEQRDE